MNKQRRLHLRELDREFVLSRAHLNDTNGGPVKELPSADRVTLSVIVPVYNEETAIRDVIQHIQNILLQTQVTYEILVVDDGSNDGSSEVLESVGGITCIRHPDNLGYGAALKTGLRHAKGEFICITDGDGTYPNETIPELLQLGNDYDMVVGARSNNSNNIPMIRRPVKWFLGKLANYLSETDIPDLNSGLRVFRKEIALRFYKLFPSGFSFTTTMTLAMHCNGYKVKYVPIEYKKRYGRSKIRPIYDTINFIQLILRTIMYFNPLKVFLPVATFLLIAFFCSSIIDIFFLANLTDKTVILFSAFLQTLVLGLLADLVEKRSL